MPIKRPPKLQRQAEKRFSRRVQRRAKEIGPKGEVTIHLPDGTESTLRLAEALERTASLHGHSGMPSAQLNRKLAKQGKLFAMLSDIARRADRGEPYARIGRSYKLSRRTVAKWHQGESMPKGLLIGAQAEAAGAKRNDVDLGAILKSPEKQRMMGYLVGAVFGNMRVLRTPHSSAAAALVSSKGFAEEIARCGREAIGADSTVKRYKSGYYHVGVGSTDFVQFFNRVTDYGKRVPTQFFGDFEQPKRLDARTGFVQAIVDSHGRVAKNPKGFKLIIQATDRRAGEYAHGVLGELGIASSLAPSGRIFVSIETENLKRFRELIGFRDGKNASALDGAIGLREKSDARHLERARVLRELGKARGHEFRSVTELMHEANGRLKNEHRLPKGTDRVARLYLGGMEHLFPNILTINPKKAEEREKMRSQAFSRIAKRGHEFETLSGAIRAANGELAAMGRPEYALDPNHGGDRRQVLERHMAPVLRKFTNMRVPAG